MYSICTVWFLCITNSCITLYTGPSPPRRVDGSVTGPKVVQLTWVEPAEPNGIISQYTVYGSVQEIPIIGGGPAPKPRKLPSPVTPFVNVMRNMCACIMSSFNTCLVQLNLFSVFWTFFLAATYSWYVIIAIMYANMKQIIIFGAWLGQSFFNYSGKCNSIDMILLIVSVHLL